MQRYRLRVASETFKLPCENYLPYRARHYKPRNSGWGKARWEFHPPANPKATIYCNRDLNHELVAQYGVVK
jgi:hypothetical protein